MIRTFVIFCILGILKGIEVIPEKPELEYYNAKYIESMKFKVQRHGRGSPYYINFNLKTLAGAGNNITISMVLYEYLSGNYVALGLQGEYKLCDFLDNEPFLGKMFMKQVPYNLTCPFPKGYYEFENIVIHLEDFPYNLPFTWESINVRTRSDVKGFITATREMVFSYKFFITINQKPKRKA